MDAVGIARPGPEDQAMEFLGKLDPERFAEFEKDLANDMYCMYELASRYKRVINRSSGSGTATLTAIFLAEADSAGDAAGEENGNFTSKKRKRKNPKKETKTTFLAGTEGAGQQKPKTKTERGKKKRRRDNNEHGGSKRQQASEGSSDEGESPKHVCYICDDESHMAYDCPHKASVKAFLDKRKKQPSGQKKQLWCQRSVPQARLSGASSS